jgi:hypothetical protein
MHPAKYIAHTDKRNFDAQKGDGRDLDTSFLALFVCILARMDASLRSPFARWVVFVAKVTLLTILLPLMGMVSLATHKK